MPKFKLKTPGTKLAQDLQTLRNASATDKSTAAQDICDQLNSKPHDSTFKAALKEQFEEVTDNSSSAAFDLEGNSFDEAINNLTDTISAAMHAASAPLPSQPLQPQSATPAPSTNTSSTPTPNANNPVSATLSAQTPSSSKPLETEREEKIKTVGALQNAFADARKVLMGDPTASDPDKKRGTTTPDEKNRILAFEKNMVSEGLRISKGIIPQALKDAEEKETKAREYLRSCEAASKTAAVNSVGEEEAKKKLETAEKDFAAARTEANLTREKVRQQIAAAIYSKATAHLALPGDKKEKQELTNDYFVTLARLAAASIVDLKCNLDGLVVNEEKDKKNEQKDLSDIIDIPTLLTKLDQAATAYHEWFKKLSTKQKDPTIVGRLSFYTKKTGEVCAEFDANNVDDAVAAFKNLVGHAKDKGERTVTLTMSGLSKDSAKAVVAQALLTKGMYVEIKPEGLTSKSAQRVLELRSELANQEKNDDGSDKVSDGLIPPNIPGPVTLLVDAMRRKSTEDFDAIINVLKGDPHALCTTYDQFLELEETEATKQMLARFLSASAGRKTAGLRTKTVADVIEETRFAKGTMSANTATGTKDPKVVFNEYKNTKINKEFNFGTRTNKKSALDQAQKQYEASKTAYEEGVKKQQKQVDQPSSTKKVV